MNCALCNRPAPSNDVAMIDAGWIPYFYNGQREMSAPVCPECCRKYLRAAKDGEWETVLPPPLDFFRWN